MRVAIYQPWVYVHGGMERLLLETISRSKHEWVVFTSHYNTKGTFNAFQKYRVKQFNSVSVRRDILSVLQAALKVSLLKLPLDGFDALVVMCDGIGDLITIRNNKLPTMTICCTPLRPVFDEVYRRKAIEQFNFVLRFTFSLFSFIFKIIDRLTWKNYARVVAISTETKRRIVQGKLYRNDKRLNICYPGIDIKTIATDITYEPFFLLPGRIMWTKNIELAIEAFCDARLPQPWKLIIAGYLDPKSIPYYEKLRNMAHGYSVEFVTSPTDKELYDLYRKASCILFSALNEDWGITPIEGMAHCKPVIATASGGPMESIIDGETGWLLKPDSALWSQKFIELVKAPAVFAEKGIRAREHSMKFDWKYFVNNVDELLDELVTEDHKMFAQKKKVKEQFHPGFYSISKITN